jgi:(E)-4-hydroxy-3-methyl-but-2-enyl pyrophosphate reductase (IPP and DMAPP forming)
MKQFLVAESAGFCFGVRRSVEMAESVLARFGSCLSYGELIHNDDVVSALQEKGMRVIASPSEAGSGDRVIIRAHGVSSSVIDYLEAAGAEVVDATCPRVKHIHRIVSRAAEEGQYVLVIGMRNHPEVEAICGWCGACSVIESEEEASAWAQLHPDLVDHPICVVVQTTQTQRFFKNCVNSLKKRCTNLRIFDTMCFATFTRQNEAAELASRCDAMVVIGGKHSANSLHLAQICQEACPNVQFVERAAELDLVKLAGCETVGLTAGASTPSWIIKEVRKAMDELKVEETIAVEEATEATAAEEKAPEAAPATETPAEEVSFDAMLEESLKSIYNGEKVTGVVTGISGTEVTVDLGMKYTGFIPTTDFTDAGEKVEDCVKLGDEIEALVVRVNDVEGTAMLSKKRLDNIKFWDDVEAAAENGSVVEGTVTETNKGGVVVNVKGVRVFVPASQTDLPREAELGQLLKNTVKLKITEVNKARKRVVGSIRRAAAAERHAMREELWNTIEVGKRYKGVVKSLTSYGAFVDIGGVDGMVHVSELSWGRIHNPAEVVKVGDELEVYVIGFDKDAHRISLGFKDPEANPWKLFTDQYSVGDVASVKIVKLMQFGAFAEVLPGVDGLIHISQVADHRIAKVDDVLHVGDVVDAKITAIDNENQKISLSIRALLEPEAPSEDADEAEETAEEEARAEEAAPAEE